MQVDALHRQVNASDLTPEKLVSSSAISEKEKIGEASRQFEALLLRQVLGEAQKPVISSTLVKDSATSSIYRDMITTQLADSLSRSGGLGLARMLEPQLQRQLGAGKADIPTGNPNARKPAEGMIRISPQSAPEQTDRSVIASKTRVIETPPHAALLMQQFSLQARHLKSHE